MNRPMKRRVIPEEDTLELMTACDHFLDSINGSSIEQEVAQMLVLEKALQFAYGKDVEKWIKEAKKDENS